MAHRQKTNQAVYDIEILLPPSPMPNQLSTLLDLSPDEKLDIIEALWASLNQSPELIALPEWQKRELDRSKAQYDAHPESLLSWEEVQANILAKHR
jgi:putative addiction module component (TIGR02574 family)